MLLSNTQPVTYCCKNSGLRTTISGRVACYGSAHIRKATPYYAKIFRDNRQQIKNKIRYLQYKIYSMHKLIYTLPVFLGMVASTGCYKHNSTATPAGIPIDPAIAAISGKHHYHGKGGTSYIANHSSHVDYWDVSRDMVISALSDSELFISEYYTSSGVFGNYGKEIATVKLIYSNADTIYFSKKNVASRAELWYIKPTSKIFISSVVSPGDSFFEDLESD